MEREGEGEKGRGGACLWMLKTGDNFYRPYKLNTTILSIYDYRIKFIAELFIVEL